jgi:hypothetical protein
MYLYRDAVLMVWVAYYYAGLQLTGLPNQKVLSNLVAELMERYERVANELGSVKESQVRELLQQFDEQIVEGDWFGLSSEFQLPVFESVKPYISPDGQIEIDALAEGSTCWAVEVKWRGRLSGRKELEKLAASVDYLISAGISAQAWFISRAGFTPEALEFAQEAGIFVSDRTAIEQLIKYLG